MANWTFSLWCVPLIKSGSVNWNWSTKILGQFVTLMHKFIAQSDVKHIMTSHIKTITSVLKVWIDIITNITARPIALTEILAIMSCLDLQNCRFSIYTIISFKTYWYILCWVLVKVLTQTYKVPQSFPKWGIPGAISMGSCYNTESLTVAHSGYDV